jgi:hypothetical protein
MASIPKKPWASLQRASPEKPATSTPVAPARRADSHTISPYAVGDPIPEAEAIEKDTDTSWALWTDLSAGQDRGFADTAPPTDTMRYSADERGYAPTVPAALAASRAQRAPARNELSVVEVMVEARRNNRVCPLPVKWQQLYDMLPDKKQSGAGWQPAPPLIDAAWNGTPSIPKRMCLREHIEWAASHGCLQQVYTFMKGLPENEWHHMGE